MGEAARLDRRMFLGVSSSCMAHMLVVPRVFARSAFERQEGRVVAQEAWGRLEEVGEGLWALVSLPLEDRTTLCNGGIISGADGVVVVESFASPAGAEWMMRQAHELTGQWPTHVVLTHYHGDHSSGVEGFTSVPSPRVMSTRTTLDLVQQSDAQRETAPAALRTAVLADVTLVSETEPTRIDLGGRTVTIVPRGGHTPSDVTVEIEDPSVVWCGDLVWNRMFPNYRDAIPSRLSRDVRALVRDRETRYVPGHGSLANGSDLDLYIKVIDDVEEAARGAVNAGTPAAEASESYQLPASLGDWMLFNPRYFEVAFGAWERELTGG